MFLPVGEKHRTRDASVSPEQQGELPLEKRTTCRNRKFPFLDSPRSWTGAIVPTSVNSIRPNRVHRG